MSKEKIVLDLCGGTGAWAKPYKDNGYNVITITLPDYDIMKAVVLKEFGIMIFPSNSDTAKDIRINIFDIYGILAAPPCTQFSIARNDKTAKKPRNLEEGLMVVDKVKEIVRGCLLYHFRKDDNGLKFWALENPKTGYLERFLGKAPFEFEACDFGDPYGKKTSLWGEFNFPKKDAVKATKRNFVKYASTDDEVKQEKLKLIPDGYRKKTGYDTRKVIRSITPQGFANAFYEANK